MKAIKYHLCNKMKIKIIFALIIFVFLVIIFTLIIKSQYVKSGPILLNNINSENVNQKVWSDGFNSVHPTSDGGYIAAGYSTDQDLNSMMCTDVYEEDAIIAKYNKKGEIIWKRYLNARDNDEYTSVQQTSDGGYIVVGEIVKAGNHLTGKSESYDAMIAKYNETGELIWNKKYGASSMSEEFNDVRQTSDGGYIVVGGKRKGYGEFDALIVKYDKTGQISWRKSYGGLEYDYFNSVQQTSDGGYVAIGSSYSNDNGGDEHPIIVKYDKTGKVVWKNIFVTDRFGYYLSVKNASDGGYLTVGYCDTSENWYDSIIVKYSEKGTVLWHKEFGGTGRDYFCSVEETSYGEYIVVGDSNSIDGDLKGLNEEGTHAIIVKYDKTGVMIKKNILKGQLSSSFDWVARTGEGKYMVLGKSSNLYKELPRGQSGKQDDIIVKYNSDLQAGEQLVLHKATDYKRQN